MASNELQKIQPGSKAQASVLNDNFQYLDNRATDIDSYAHSVASTAATNLNNYITQNDSITGGLRRDVNAAQDTANNATKKASSAAGGKWKWSHEEIYDGAFNVSGHKREYNLKNYLPNDGGNYELYVHAYARDVRTASKWVRISTDTFGKNTDTGGTYAQLFVTAYADVSVNDFILPATSSGKLIISSNDSSFDRLVVKLFGYRKLGV